MVLAVKMLGRIKCSLRPRQDNITCILLCGDEVLLVDYKHGTGWNFPTEIVRIDESPTEAAHRGMRYRLSFPISHAIPLGRLFCKFGCRREIMYCFLSRVTTKEFNITDVRARGAEWFHVERLPENLSEFAREVIEKWFDEL